MLSRIKFELDPLVNEMLDQLPKKVWASTTTTFLDPAMGGGQFVKEVERRLREAGHSDANIAKRVFGCEELPHRVEYAISKHKLVGQYAAVNFLKQDFKNMKFDVLVGNPPYQDPNNDKRMLWNQIVDKAVEVTKDDGYIAIVTPSTWLYSKSNIHNSYKMFEDKQVEKAVIYDKNDTPFDEGTSVSYTIVKNQPATTKADLYYAQYSTKQSTLVDSINIKKDKVWPGSLTPLNLSIHNKLKKHAKIKFIKSCEFHNQTLKKKKLVADAKSKDFPYTHHVSAAITRYTSVKFSKHAQWKVMVPVTSTIDKAVINNNCGHGEDMLSLYVDNKDTAKNIKNLFNTKFYKFVGKLYKFGRNQPLQNIFPLLDFDKAWTDKDLYKYFKLTRAEIDYIESDVK